MDLERLEARELLAYTPLGYSLPDLTVSGYTSTAASWNGSLTVTLNVRNIGTETLIAPTALLPGATSPADSAPTTVAVLINPKRHPKNVVQVGSVPLSSIRQNSLVQVSQTLTLPNQPAGFPGDGGDVDVSFVINPTMSVPESDYTNNRAKSTSNPLLIESPFPELQVTNLDVPPVMQPGDTIQPNIRLANLGPAATAAQGPVTVALVASTSRKINTGSAIIASYTVPNIPGISQVSSGTKIFGDANLTPQNNFATINGAPVTLPTSPRIYYIGVVVDPGHQIKQVHVIGKVSNPNALLFSQKVGPRIKGLSPAGVLYPGGGAGNLGFPYPPNVNPSGTVSTNPQSGIKTS